MYVFEFYCTQICKYKYIYIYSLVYAYMCPEKTCRTHLDITDIKNKCACRHIYIYIYLFIYLSILE